MFGRRRQHFWHTSPFSGLKQKEKIAKQTVIKTLRSIAWDSSDMHETLQDKRKVYLGSQRLSERREVAAFQGKELHVIYNYWNTVTLMRRVVVVVWF